jgi:hypothetical protein
MKDFFLRLSEITENEGINITTLEQRIGASQGVLSRAKRNNTSISLEWVIKLLEIFPMYNANWLLRGRGEMKEIPYLEPKNWIVDDLPRYKSCNHNSGSLERLGLRLDEISKEKKITYQDLADLLNIDYSYLLQLIAGNERVPLSIVKRIMKQIPEINPLWLILGMDDMTNKEEIKEVDFLRESNILLRSQIKDKEEKEEMYREKVAKLEQELEELKKRTHTTENVDRRTA